MAVIPTGSASLRGVGPRAPRITPGAFESDIQKFANAATAPTRVAEVIGRGTEARRERGIKEATFDDRLATAKIQSEGDVATAQNAADLAFLQGQAEVENFGASNQATVAGIDNEIASEEEKALNIANRIDTLRKTQAQIRQTAEQEAATALTKSKVEAVEEGTALSVAEGTPITRFEDRPGVGRVKITEVKTPTKGIINLGEETVATQAQLDVEAAQLKAAQQRAEAFMLQQQRLNRGKTVPFVNRSPMGRPISITVVTTAPDGEVSVETFPTDPKEAQPQPTEDEGRIEFNLPSEEEVETFGAPAAPSQLTAPAAPAAPGPAAEPVTESGSTFNPTGESVPPYTRGEVGNLPDGTEVIYTGGDPLNPDNFKPIQ